MSSRSQTRVSAGPALRLQIQSRVSQRVAGLAALFVLLVIATWRGRVHEDLIDFDVDSRAGQRLLRGEDLAQPEDGRFVDKYLPGAAILEAPFALLPRPAARLVLYLVSVGVMLAALHQQQLTAIADQPGEALRNVDVGREARGLGHYLPAAGPQLHSRS